MGIQSQQLKTVDQFLVFTDDTAAPASSTINNAGGYAVGATSIVVASGAAFANNQVVRFSSDEDYEYQVITNIVTNTLTISPGLRRARLNGDAVVKQVVDRYGPVVEGTCKVRWRRESTDYPTTDQRLPFAILKGYGGMNVELSLAAPTLESIALAAGIPRANVLGTGTSADPKHLITTGADMGTMVNTGIMLIGTLNDNSVIRVEGYGAVFDYTGIQFQFARGQQPAVPVKMLCGAGGYVYFAAGSPPGITTTYLATSGDVLDGLVDAGAFTDGATTATTSTASNAGQKVINVASGGASFTNGMWVRVPNVFGNEFHQVESSTATAITLKTNLKRTIANGAAIVITSQTLVTFSSIDTNGVSVNIGGSVTEVRSGLRDMAAGLRAGAASVSVSMGLQQFSRANFAYALGLTDPGSGGLATLGNLGAVQLNGFFTKGTTQGGKTLWLNTWGNDADVSGVEVPFNTQGEAPPIPVTLKPRSALFFQLS